VATAIAPRSSKQGAATQEITRSTQHAAQSTKNVADNITGVKAGADAAAVAADGCETRLRDGWKRRAQQLGSQVTQFSGENRAA